MTYEAIEKKAVAKQPPYEHVDFPVVSFTVSVRYCLGYNTLLLSSLVAGRWCLR